MAITTLQGVLNGLLPPLRYAKPALTASSVGLGALTSHYVTGYPANASANSAGLAGAAVTSSPWPFANPTGGANAYIARLSKQPGFANLNLSQYSTLLVDRLWNNSGLNVTLTTAQTINSVAFPPRDRNGSTNGDGVHVLLEVTAVVGAGTPTLTMSYTNSAGVAGRTATNINATVANAAANSVLFMGLDAGDTGVRSIQSFTFSATWTSGSVALVAYRPLVLMSAGLEYGGVNPDADAINLALPRVYDNTALQMLYIATGAITMPTQTGLVTYAHG